MYQTICMLLIIFFQPVPRDPSSSPTVRWSVEKLAVKLKCTIDTFGHRRLSHLPLLTPPSRLYSPIVISLLHLAVSAFLSVCNKQRENYHYQSVRPAQHDHHSAGAIDDHSFHLSSSLTNFYCLLSRQLSNYQVGMKLRKVRERKGVNDTC